MINSPDITRPAKQAWSSRRRVVQPGRARTCTLIPRYSSVSPASELTNTKYRRLSFKVPLHVSYGETVFVVGLTSWEASSAQPLQWTEGDVWTGEFKVAVQEAPIEFKLLKQSNGNFNCGQETLSHIVWQPGVNQSIIIPEDIEAVDVTCSWVGSIQVLPSKAALDEEEDRHHTPAALSENSQQCMKIQKDTISQLGDEIISQMDDSTRVGFVMTSSPVKLLSNIVSAGALLQAVEKMKDTVWATTVVHTNKVVHTVDTTSGPQRLFPATSKDEKAHDYEAVTATKTDDAHLIPDHMVIMPNLECEGRGLAMRKDGGVDSTGHDMNTAAGLCVVEELAVMSKGTAMMLTHGFNSAITSLALKPLLVVLPPIGWASSLTASLQASLVKMWRKCVALLLLALWRSRFI